MAAQAYLMRKNNDLDQIICILFAVKKCGACLKGLILIVCIIEVCIKDLIWSLLLVALLQPASAMAQIDAGNDTVSCSSPVTLTALVTPRPSTSTYTVEPIPFNPESFTAGTIIPLTDDGYTSALPIGFQFSFFGQSYSQFYISANGWISFTAANLFAQVNNNPSAFPSTSNNVPKNAIAIWEDWNPPQGGTVNYYTTGTAPNRRLVVNWNNVPHYQCTNQLLKAQVILNEGSNYIEYHIANKGSCPTWQSGNATQGLHNQAGTQAITIPGRNAAVFSLTNDGYGFRPSGAPEAPAISWFDLNTGGPAIGTGPLITVSPVNSTSYRAEVSYCCSPGSFSDTVLVVVDKSTLSVSSTNVSCFGGSDGSATVMVSGSNPPYTYSWSYSSSDTLSTISNIPKGTYYVEVMHGSCVFQDTVHILEPSPLLIESGMIPESCGDTSGVAYASATGGEVPYQYSWTAGVANDSLIDVPSGLYQVTVTDNNGCTASSTVEVTQVSNVNADFSASVFTGSSPLAVNFLNSSSGAETYLWDFGQGSTSTEMNPSFSFEDEGSYVVLLTATHAGICQDQYSVTIHVLNDSVPLIDSVFIPNIIVLNSTSQENRIFRVKGLNLEEVNISIFNRWGKEVFNTIDLQAGWDGGKEPSGTYYYIVRYREKGKEPVMVKSFLTLFR